MTKAAIGALESWRPDFESLATCLLGLQGRVMSRRSHNSTLSENFFKLQATGKDDSMVATDCKSPLDLVSRTTPPACQEFRTLLQARLIKEHLATGVTIRWVPSSAQVADCPTKIMNNSTLREVLQVGRRQLQDEDELHCNRSDRKARLKWIRSHQVSENARG